jgi:hypothetical protein
MATASLVVIGDTHLAPGPRQADKLAALDMIVAHGLALPDLGAWLWPGDLFHSTSTPADRNALKEVVKRMANVAPVVICYGNHDAAGDLDIFADLGAKFPIVVVDRPQVVRVDLPTNRLAVFVLPYPHKGGLVGAGVAHEALTLAAREALAPAFMLAAAELEDLAAKGVATAFIGHVNIGGACASTGQPQIGREIELDPELLARLGNIPKFVNHIHLPQYLHGAYIPGSIAAMDFGEMEEKRFLVAHGTCADVAGARWKWTIDSRPLVVARQYHIEGALTRDGFAYKVTAGPGGLELVPPASWKGADVRVRFTYRKGDYNPMQQAQIHAEFAEARTLKVEGSPIREEALRAPEVVAAVSLSDKLEQFCALTGVPWTEGLAAKVDALQQLTAEQIIARWHDRPTETAVAS